MTKAQMQADIDFLARRAASAGSFGTREDDRDTGASSNSIVAIAYGIKPLKDQFMPGDVHDLAACQRMWARLPDHRKRGDALTAMVLATAEMGAF